MTTEEKRKAIREECCKYKICDECPYEGNMFCGNFSHYTCEDYTIDDWYKEFFGNAETTEPAIKDSGDRRQFYDADGNPLAVRDMSEGKGRMDLLPWAAIIEVSKHSENGARKYGEHNVDKGLNTSSFADSGMRHLAKWIDGWKDEPHLLAAAWNLLWAIQMELKHPELCDIPWRSEE